MLVSNKILVTILFFFICHFLIGQTPSDFVKIRSYSQNLEAEKPNNSEIYKKQISNNKSELDYLFSSLFLIYKKFISSQDFNHCVFHPSCSVYGIESIKHNGLLFGSIRTFDRMTRCHGFNSNNYKKDYEKQRLLDPVIPNE